jgi:AGCS family alanine or glycine:cation symporter
MAVAFALFASIAGFDIGNMVQANSIANALNANFVIPEWLTEIVLVVLVGAVLLGGIERISTVAGKLVPIMAIAYMAAGTLVLALNAEAIPTAFTPIAATGGFAGYRWLHHRGISNGVRLHDDPGLELLMRAISCLFIRR